MEPEVQHEKDTAQHPDVDSIIDWILEIQIDHLRWSVHQSCMLFESLLIVIYLGFRDCLQVYLFSTTTSKIAQFRHSISQQNVLYFQVLVNDAQIMHFLHPINRIFEDLQNLVLGQCSICLFCCSDEVIHCFLCQLHQDICLQIAIPLNLMISVITNDMFA